MPDDTGFATMKIAMTVMMALMIKTTMTTTMKITITNDDNGSDVKIEHWILNSIKTWIRLHSDAFGIYFAAHPECFLPKKRENELEEKSHRC